MVHGTVLLVKPAVKYIAKWLLRSLQGFPECAMLLQEERERSLSRKDVTLSRRESALQVAGGSYTWWLVAGGSYTALVHSTFYNPTAGGEGRVTEQDRLEHPRPRGFTVKAKE